MSWFEELPSEHQEQFKDYADKSPVDVLTELSEVKGRTFYDALPEELRTNEAFTPYKDMKPEDIVKSHAELKAKAIVPPADDASDEEKQAYQMKLRQIVGVPDSPEGYELGLPEGIPKDDPLLVEYVKEAHKVGMNNGQVQAGIQTVAKFFQEQREAQKAETETTLKKEWGAEFDTKLADAITAMKEVAKESGLSVDEATKMLNQTGWGDNLIMVRMFSNIARHYKEGRMGGTGGKQEKDVASKFFPGSDTIK